MPGPIKQGTIPDVPEGVQVAVQEYRNDFLYWKVLTRISGASLFGTLASESEQRHLYWVEKDQVFNNWENVNQYIVLGMS